MGRIVQLVIVLALVLASGIGGPDPAAAQAVSDTVDVLVVGSQLAYEKEKITATAGEELVIRLVNEGTLPHNLVVVRSEKSINAVGMAALDAADNEYIPESEMKRILGYSPLAKPKQTVSFTITVPPPGEYPYICTFPGHFRSMQGVLISEE